MLIEISCRICRNESDTFILLQEPQLYIGLARTAKRFWLDTLFRRLLMLIAGTIMEVLLYIGLHMKGTVIL
jgi:hypothetical protein